MAEKISDFIQIYGSSLEWGHTLRRISSEDWLRPMRNGGWSVAECLAHLIAWDRFMVMERLLNLQAGMNFTHRPDGESINSNAAKYARSGVQQVTLIEEFIAERLRLIELVQSISQSAGDVEFAIYGKPINLSTYLHGQAEHHVHHQAQIDLFVQGLGAKKDRC